MPDAGLLPPPIESLDAFAQKFEPNNYQEKARESVTLALAGHIRKAFLAAHNQRTRGGASGPSITSRLLSCQRQRQGVYEQNVLAEIRKIGGCETYFNITETKCDAAQAWISDLLTDDSWDIQPTPIPDLPDETKSRIIEIVTQAYSGMDPSMIDPAEIQEMTLRTYDEALKLAKEDAADRALRMKDKMSDQLVEGGYFEALGDFINYLCTYPLAILKGPVIKSVKRLEWKDGQPNVISENVPTWEAINPHDFFPGPNARNLKSSYICQIVHFEKSELSSMRDVEGWSREAIDAVLANGGRNASIEVMGDAERRVMESLNVENEGQDSSVEAIEYWGSASGEMLAEWGMQDIDDLNAYYEITGILVGDQVIRAVLNPDKIGRRIYYATSFAKVVGSIWGQALTEKMRDCQDGYNASLRTAANNMGLASGPQIFVDLDAVPANFDFSKITPWMVWQFQSSKSKSNTPISAFQPDDNTTKLLAMADYFDQKADDRTMIPRYSYGNENVTGAGKTASGLSMLMDATTKGIKEILGNCDREVINPLITQLYNWNMQYLPDEEIKGDCQIVASGSLAKIVREQTQMKRQEFLDRTNNPTDLQIIGIKGRAELLRHIAEDLNIPEDKIVPSEQEIADIMARQEQMAAGMQEVDPNAAQTA